MLGVHRPSNSIVAGAFQQAGTIHYHSGHMTILKRGALEQACCECYGIVNQQYARTVGLLCEKKSLTAFNGAARAMEAALWKPQSGKVIVCHGLLPIAPLEGMATFASLSSGLPSVMEGRLVAGKRPVALR
jgi:hypothetical protein